MEFSWVRQFIGEMHQLKNERAVLRLHAREVLARLDHDLGDANLVAVLERIAQKRVGFIAAFLRLKIVRLVEKYWIDVFLIDEVLNIHRLRGLEIDMLEIFILEHDVFPLLVLVALHDLVPGNFPAILLGNTLVVNRTQIALAQQTKLEFLPSRSGIKSDRNINQTEADAAFPTCARHTKLFRRACPVYVQVGAVHRTARGRLRSIAPTNVPSTQPARVAGERCRAIRRAGSASLQSNCSDTMRQR